MWRDWEQRAKEIMEYAAHFKKEGYSDVPRRLEHLIAGMAEKRDMKVLERELEEVRADFRLEFSSGGPSYARSLSFVEPVMNFYFTRPDLQSKFQPLFEDLARNSKNLKHIDDAFKSSSGSTRFYGKCFLYLINAEGMFDEAVSLLYGLFLDFVGKATTVAELHRKSCKTIQAEMLKANAPSAIFEGWMDGHVRNAIAHCRFYYEQAKRTMSFHERPRESGKEWCASCTVDEFDELYRKLDNPWHVISHLNLLMRIVGLVLSPDVPGVGMLSPIGQ